MATKKATKTVALADLPKLGELLEGAEFRGLTTKPDGTHCAVFVLAFSEKQAKQRAVSDDEAMTLIDEAIAAWKAEKAAPCKGMNCGATDGVSHSAECFAEYAATIDPGVGQRHPEYRYAGYKGRPFPASASEDQQAAWVVGFKAQMPPHSAATPSAEPLTDELERAYRCIQGMHNAFSQGTPFTAQAYHALTIAAAKRFVFENALDGSDYFVGKPVEVLHAALALPDGVKLAGKDGAARHER